MPALNQSIVCPVLIGRAAQLDALNSVLRHALQGEPRTVLLSGEAGIGKSRLVAEAIALCRENGFEAVQGNCFEQDRALPYSAILELLRSYFASLPGELESLIGPLTSEVVKVAPELLPGVTPAPVVDPDQEKRRVFYALAQVFLRLAARQPLLIVVEDLHWSDETTQQFLTYFTRQLSNIHDRPILILLTYRSDEVDATLNHFLAEVDRQRLASEIALTALTRAEVDVMVRAIFELQRGVRRDYLDALHERTEGNPFFIEEILKSSISIAAELTEVSEPDRRSPAPAVIPRTIQDAVRQRAARVSEDARHLLELAAVAGQRFDLTLLSQLTGETPSVVLDQTKELLSAQLVMEESGDRFRFRHALTREAIYSNLLLVERRELHRRIAEEIETGIDGSPEGLDRHLADLAFHFYQAEAWEKAVLYCQRAGERAQELFTPSAAVQHLSHAIEASRRLGVSASARLFRLRAAAYEVLGQFESALADHEAALTTARTSGDQEEEWEILLGLGMLWSARDYGIAREHYGAALDLARALGDQRLVARSLNRVGNYQVNIEEPGEGVAYHEEALRIFEALNDAEGIAETLDLLGMAWLLGGDLARSRAYYERAARLFDEQDNRPGSISCLTTMAILTTVYHTDTLPPAATFVEAAAWLDKTNRMAAEIGWRSGECYALWNQGVCLGPQGEYAAALDRTREAIVIAEETEHREWMSAALYVLGAIQLDLLDFVESRASLEQALGIARECGSLLWTRIEAATLARCCVEQGDLTLASETLDAVLPVDAPAQTLGQRMVHSARARLRIAQEEPAEALQILDRLALPQKSAAGGVPRLAKLRADALCLQGSYAAAESLYISAAAEAQERGALGQLWPMQAGLTLLYDRSGEREKARQAHAEATRVIEYLSGRMPDEEAGSAFREAALARLPSIRGPTLRQAAKVALGGLTEREREVASLVAAGKSNAAISQALVISERTAETHVTNILSKLGFTSRAQIAAWAVERGLSKQELT